MDKRFQRSDTPLAPALLPAIPLVVADKDAGATWMCVSSPSDEAATKLLFLALRNIVKDWKMPPRTWKEAANQFAIVFGERFTASLN